MEILNIEKEKAINAYQQGSEEQKKVLEKVFGVETFKPKTIKDRIKTFDDALKELGKDHPLVKEYNVINNNKTTYNMKHYSQLCVITAALNEGWRPKFVEGEKRYFPYFRLYSSEEISQMSKEEKSSVVYLSCDYASGGVSYAGARHGSAYVHPSIGSRFAFKTNELAEYAGKQFADLYVDYLLGE
jgi:hypothetical protein